jgi:hypothetical protein
MLYKWWWKREMASLPERKKNTGNVEQRLNDAEKRRRDVEQERKRKNTEKFKELYEKDIQKLYKDCSGNISDRRVVAFKNKLRYTATVYLGISATEFDALFNTCFRPLGQLLSELRAECLRMIATLG